MRLRWWNVRRPELAGGPKRMGILGSRPIVLLGNGGDYDDISSSIKHLLTLIKIDYILFTIVYLI